jgi:hypothetical protein
MIEIVFDFVLAAAVTVGIVVVMVQLHQYQEAVVIAKNLDSQFG